MSKSKTPEQIFKAAWHEADERGEKGSRVAAGIAALRAAGLLVGDPTEEQVRRAARVIFGGYVIHDEARIEWQAYSYDREKAEYVARRALTAAGVAPQDGVLAALIRETLARDDEDDRRAGEYIDPKARRLQIANRTISRIEAALNEVAPQAPAKDLSTSAGNVKNHADSFNVAPQEPSEYPYEDHLLFRAPQVPNEEGLTEEDFEASSLYSGNNKPAPSSDREKLIAEIESRRKFYSGQYEEGSEIDLMFKAADALAAQPVLDPEKVAEVIQQNRTWTKVMDDGYPSTGFNTPSDIARALCEAAKRGELT